jgi:hypothetical protein
MNPDLLVWPDALHPADVVVLARDDGKPVPKGRPRLGKGGNVYTPAATLAYEAASWRRRNVPRPRPVSDSVPIQGGVLR